MVARNAPLERPNFWWHLAWISWWSAWLCYVVFSYSLTAPNLILSHFEGYWRFQTWMWATFFNNRPLLTYSYLGLITWLVANYFWLGSYFIMGKRTPKPWTLLGLFGVLLISNNALSYDVFNYIFNAKMVLVYGANPHVKVALDFLDDPWIRFMHNTHTPAPYGYGWTALSLIPAGLGFGKFLPTWLLFRAWSGVSLLLGWFSLEWLAKRLGLTATHSWHQQRWWLWLNPLLWLELVTNSHNDWWMLVPAVLALGLVAILPRQSGKWWPVLLSGVLLAASASIKFASLALVPLWLSLVLVQLEIPWLKLKKPRAWLHMYWPTLAAVAMFLPLLTERSQQFHPWYLTWVLIWWPLSIALAPKSSLVHWWWRFIALLSITSLLRYVPYLFASEFLPGVLRTQKLITWSAVGLTLLAAALPTAQKVVQLRNKHRTKYHY